MDSFPEHGSVCRMPASGNFQEIVLNRLRRDHFARSAASGEPWFPDKKERRRLEKFWKIFWFFLREEFRPPENVSYAGTGEKREIWNRSRTDSVRRAGRVYFFKDELRGISPDGVKNSRAALDGSCSGAVVASIFSRKYRRRPDVQK